ncbi:uncharacterized protein LOC131856335 [Cryptomeria japonica]|uniref:uncharacterized protein LOC131856335 n=1 Tax=Cryptomeria japonica TaxID=3369 RepID=UPI0027DA2EC2|nr:uncharacterized protein LOC131856335 [Cryptomeria japonica]
MAFKREYAYFFAVMMGMAMLMAAATSVVAEGDTERSKPQRLSQNTTEAPIAVKLSKTTEMKSGASDNLPGDSTDMAIYEQAHKRTKILYIIILLLLAFLAFLWFHRFLADFIFI